MFFVHLRAMMRSMPMKISALALVLWYVVSIIGFGVHTCGASQRSFLTSFVTGMTCEEVHASESHDCEGDHCCSHDHENEEGCEDCEDEYMNLEVTGTPQSLENDIHVECQVLPVLYDVPAIADICTPALNLEILRIKSLPDSGLIASGDVQSVLGIWRI